MKLLFLDESGDHSLAKIDEDYPVFVLGGIIVDRTHYREVVEPQVQQLKQDHLGNASMILHTSDIIRGKNGFEPLNNAQTRAKFYGALNTLMQELEYTIVACAIMKDEHVKRYGARAEDPYMHSLRVVVERFCHEIGAMEDGGTIFAEKRRPDLDHELDLAWQQLKRQKAGETSGERIDRLIVDLSLKDKRLNVAGLQLADLVVSPIGRAVIGKNPREDWQIVERKFLRGQSGYRGYGLIVRPG